MSEKDLLTSISKRLGVLIALELNKDPDEPSKPSLAGNVRLLTRFGLSSSEIAEILNTSVNSVNVTRTRLKNKK